MVITSGYLQSPVFQEDSYFSKRGKTGPKWLKTRGFLKIFHYFNLNLGSLKVFLWKFILLGLCLHRSHIWENYGWVTCQNSQSDCRILKSAISQKLNKSVWFSACSCRFKKYKIRFVNFCLGDVKNVLGQSDRRIFESSIFHVRMYESA